jgi:hypothetical protein
MGKHMVNNSYISLSAALAELATIEDDVAVFAIRPFTLDSPAMIAPLTDDDDVPPELVQADYSCFLEAHIAREIVDDRVRHTLSPKQIVDLLFHYGTHDGFPDWANELLAFDPRI